ncbi:MAG: carboxypeptidase regulatory-like domain-containing protein [Methanophagales archaeon]|nr:carboxypeptidase regulatory-like domain-containing protein [Methanophagales archaeon]
MKNKNREKLLCATVAVILVLSAFVVGIVPVSAQGASVTRVLPEAVKTNQEFAVTLIQSGFFLYGNVTETLPAGFGYVSGSYTGKGNVTDNPSTRKLSMEFIDETSVTYRVKASSYDQIPAAFSGTYVAPIWNGTHLVIESGTVGGSQEVVVDGTLPYTTGHNPANGATGVPVGTNIVVQVRDNGSGVNHTTIKVTVNGVPVTPGILPIDLTLNFSVTYDPPVNFSYGEVVTVTINASDRAGNAMTTDKYSFTTETGVVAGSIAGRITYTCNTTGIAGVSVNLTNLTGVVKTTTTNATGYYNFTGVSPGSYSVNASKPRFWGNSTAVTVTDGATTTANMMLWLKGDLNNNGLAADAGDLAKIKDASVGKISPDWKYDLNDNGIFADAGDLAKMKDASVGKIFLT